MVWTAAWTDFVICLLFGWLGVHKFREKKIGMGILYLCTFGLFCMQGGRQYGKEQSG